MNDVRFKEIFGLDPSNFVITKITKLTKSGKKKIKTDQFSQARFHNFLACRGWLHLNGEASAFCDRKFGDGSYQFVVSNYFEGK